MTRVEIYTTPTCFYCRTAKSLLAKKGVNYEETDVSGEPELRHRMMSRSGGRHTVPQIFINGRHVGGSDELHALDRAGKLDAMLAA